MVRLRYLGAMHRLGLAPHRLLLCALLLALTACGESPPPPADAGMDAGESAMDSGQDAGPAAPDVCDALGLPRTAFRTTGTGTGLGDVAGDFRVNQHDGTVWHLEASWTGCESYVFFTHFPGLTDDLFRTYPDALFLEGPRNVHYFFMSNDADAAARAEFIAGLASGFRDGLTESLPDPAEQAFWSERFHFVTDRATEVEGSVGAHLTDYIAWARTPAAIVDLGDRGRAPAPAPVVIGIDRAQTFDAGDNLSTSVGGPDTFGMAAFLGHFYQYRGALEARLAAEAATTTTVSLLDETTTGRVFRPTVTLPSAAEMAAFDALSVDIVIDCRNGNPFGCSEWDRIADVQLCVDGEACTDRREIARWITPYWRRGRQHYLIDATPFLGLLREGGARTFFVELGPEWERPTEWVAQVSLRFRTEGSAPRATGGLLAFRGGGFDANYNTREPFTFTVPAGATRVELVTILSGHGQTDGDGCAEWCDHQHLFTVNGTVLPSIAHGGPRIGSPRGCAARAVDGVIPGQWGNWAQSRAYWCPGLPVQAERTDITAQVRPGVESTMTYEGRFAGSTPRGGDIALSAYVVWYE